MDKNYIEKLLEGVDSSAGSLQGVEWKSLGEVCIRTKGTKITASQMKVLHKENAPLKIFAGGKTVAFVAFDDIPEKDINREPSIIVKSRGNIEFEYYDQPFSHKNEMWSYHSKNENINIKFVYYFLKIHESYFQNIGARMQMPQISTPDTEKFKIPIPPLSVQKEIVRILDTFTELTAELTARKQQYSFYREELLGFSDELLVDSGQRKVEWRTLEDISKKVTSGVTPLASNPDFYDGDIPWLRTGEVRFTDIWDTKVKVTEKALKETSLKWIAANCVIIAISGATAGRVGINKIPLTTNQHCCCFDINNNQANYRYVFHYLSCVNQKILLLKQGARGDLNAGMLKRFEIPLPSLEEQERIVSILDKFDTLTNSISEGLPKEIELRQKQYEYYRDLLLKFDTTKE